MLFSEPKIPQLVGARVWGRIRIRFSALQRAENSSIGVEPEDLTRRESFSALQRAENSSIPPRARGHRRNAEVSVLFSEPKIPQSFGAGRCGGDERRFQCSSASRKFLNNAGSVRRSIRACVSVLFSEPKIPQSKLRLGITSLTQSFSALQRAENSSI